MPRPSYIEIEGRRIAWREILQLRREQRERARASAQPALFELKLDVRPKGERTSDARYLEPTLFGDRP